MQGFQSNSLDFLLIRLQETLFNPDTPPFAHRLVIVPNASVKSWLQFQMAKQAGISTAMHVVSERSAISKLAAMSKNTTNIHLPSRLELSLALEPLILERSRTDETLAALIGSNKHRRARVLAEELAGLFDSYAVYGNKVATQWSQNDGWQKYLWVELFKRYPGWKTTSAICDSIKALDSNQTLLIAVFGLNYILPPLHRLLKRLGTTHDVSYFMPSLCQQYWDDIRSDREQFAMPEPDLYSNDRNPLAANYGSVGRATTRQLNDADVDLQGQYFVSQAILDLQTYAELANEETYPLPSGHQPTLLEAIQADVLLLRNSNDVIAVPQDDKSVQIHAASSAVREVEVLYNNLMGLIDQHGYSPSDILVIAPDITDYYSLIRAIFGSKDSQLPYRVHGVPLAMHNSLLQSLLNLLALARSRWDSLSLIQLLEDRFVSEHFVLSSEDLAKIRLWIEETNITWGLSAENRNDILLRAHCQNGMGSDAHIGTWDDGLKKLRHALISGGQEPQLNFSDADLLGRLICLLDSLAQDLKLLVDGTTMSLEDWAVYLKSLCEGYLAANSTDLDAVNQIVNRLAQTSKWFPEEQFEFSSIQPRLESIISQEKTAVHDGLLQSIHFGSIRDLVGLPAKVIAVLGMQEGAFPIASRQHPLDMLKGQPGADHQPTLTDMDRYYFLRTLMAAEQHLILSYQNVSLQDGKQQEPALPISELVAYTRSRYRCSLKEVTHPFYSFDPIYFTAKSGIKSYRSKDYIGAMALCGERQEGLKGFVPELFCSEVSDSFTNEPTVVITVKELMKCSKNPLAAYLAAQGVYYKDFDDFGIETEEPLSLDQLQLYSIKQDLIGKPIQTVLERAHAKGGMPLGIFGEVAKLQPNDMAASFKASLREFGISWDDLSHFEFAVNCSEPRQIGNRTWQLPAPKIALENGTTVLITGKLSNVSPQGILIANKGDESRVVQQWPALLLLQYLPPKATQPRLLFAENAMATSEYEDDAKSHLEHFLSYALTVKHRPSPLIDKWVPDFVKGDSLADIQQKIVKSLESDRFFNKEAQWLLSICQSFEPSALQTWQEIAQSLYSVPLAMFKEAKK
ncbi:MAG: exodeoxyribonuclease V subunit gamma [Chlamydiales bacterium]|nr:exodeoxyribonuclease V subunit gamma [Chlamydiales bacterium]